MDQSWTGTHVTASAPAIVVKYKGPTNHRCSHWIASCYRDADTTYRVSVSFQDGPIAAAEKLLAQHGWTWELVSVGSIDAETYVIVTR